MTAVRSEQRGVFVDSAQMYLRSIYELEEEEGIAPTRAALRSRLGLTRSAVNQRVAGLAGQGLVALSPHMRVLLTTTGRTAAIVVMRKHRLAERLLVDVIGLDWELSHVEASRWQHVLGDAVERKLVGILDDPGFSPFGNPIPGLGDLDPSMAQRCSASGGGETGRSLVRLDAVARGGGGPATVCRILEALQSDLCTLARLRAAGVVPGNGIRIDVSGCDEAGVRVASATGGLVLDTGAAREILVARCVADGAAHRRRREVDRVPRTEG